MPPPKVPSRFVRACGKMSDDDVFDGMEMREDLLAAHRQEDRPWEGPPTKAGCFCGIWRESSAAVPEQVFRGGTAAPTESVVVL